MQANFKTPSELHVELFGVKLASPILIASGPISDSKERILSWHESGIGSVVTKTITTEHANYDDKKGPKRIIQLPNGLGAINASTYSKKSVEEWSEIIRELLGKGVTVIPSIFERDPVRLGEKAKIIGKSGCIAIELGISCPNDDDKKEMNMDLIGQYVSEARKSTDVPIILKLPATDGYMSKIKSAINKGVDAISISDTLPAVRCDIDTRKLWFNGPAGYSGAGIKPIVLNAIYNIRKAGIRIPILGIGGAQTGEDIIEFMMLGVSVVQVCTALMYGKEEHLRKMNDQMYAWCKKHNTALKDIKPVI